jgi:hypothetical protein
VDAALQAHLEATGADGSLPTRVEGLRGGPPPGPSARPFQRGQGGEEVGSPALAPVTVTAFAGAGLRRGSHPGWIAQRLPPGNARLAGRSRAAATRLRHARPPGPGGGAAPWLGVTLLPGCALGGRSGPLGARSGLAVAARTLRGRGRPGPLPGSPARVRCEAAGDSLGCAWCPLFCR